MKDATEIVVVMDKSGSMAGTMDDAIGGFNQFVEDQKKEKGEANLTLILFDTDYSVVYAGKPIQAVEPLTPETYIPGGMTALLDAVGKAVTSTGKRLADMAEEVRPEKVICVIITDGAENSSHEHSQEAVTKMVKHQEEKYDWGFVYLGANVDVFAEAGRLGIQPKMAAMYAQNAVGTRAASKGMGQAVSSYRGGGKEALMDCNIQHCVDEASKTDGSSG
jgi:uncharacterized protein YegL